MSYSGSETALAFSLEVKMQIKLVETNSSVWKYHVLWKMRGLGLMFHHRFMSVAFPAENLGEAILIKKALPNTFRIGV